MTLIFCLPLELKVSLRHSYVMRKTNARVILSKVTVLAYFKMKEKEDKKRRESVTNLLQKSFNKFFNRHGLIVMKYGATLREIRLAIQA